MRTFEIEPREAMLERGNAAAQELAEQVRNSLYAPKYHISAPSGWINDPNGLVRFGDTYHVFYQHYPYAPKWGPMHWGHVTSKDLAHWKHEPIALAPDQPYETGCFSGSAVDDNGVLTLMYTAHNDNSPVKETQCIARSFDGGKTFVKSPLNPVIPMYPDGCTADFRDPKVWKQDGKWHVVVGTSSGGHGCAVLYDSDDLERWTYRSHMMDSDGTQGHMWECPTFCRVDGQDILLFSPMGMEGHKNVAVFGSFDCAAGRMTQDHLQEIDYGQSFYAAQAFEENGRALLFSWMNMWGDACPAEADGWNGSLTIPRELHVKEGRLLQVPAPELTALRGEKIIDGGCIHCVGKMTERAVELDIRHEGELEFALSDDDGELVRLSIADRQATFTLPGGTVKTIPLTLSSPDFDLRIFVDHCSVEFFVGGGEVCMTQSVYPRDGKVHYRMSGSCKVDAWKMNAAFEVK